MQYKYRKKKKDQRKEWGEEGKMRRREKVWCHENWALFKDLLIERGGSSILTYSCKCINFGRSKTQAFFKNMEKFILSLDQIVRWVMGSLEFFTRDYFFCSLTELAWCELPGSVITSTALWSWWSSLFQKGEVIRRRCTWSGTCLAALDAFDVICFQKWTKLSHGAPVQLLSLILGLSSAWWRIGSRSLGTSGFVVSPCNLQVFRQHPALYLRTSGVPTTRRQYGAELFTLGALFLAHMAMAGSASLNVEMILRVIPPLKWHDWLDRNGR